MLDERAGMRSDMTVTRLGPQHFRVLSGAGAGPRDLAWLHRQAAARGFQVTIRDVSALYGAIGLWWPQARAILAATTADDVSNAGFPYYTAREITIGAAACYALRVSYVGELGWEIYVPADTALHVWDTLWAAGGGGSAAAGGLIAAGMGAMDSLRIEKGYRRLGYDMDAYDTPLEAGMLHTVRFKKGDFVGREALLARKEQPLARKLACLTLDRPGDVVLGREPILDDGRGPGGRRVVGFVSSANTGYSLGKHVAYGYLPPALAEPGQKLAIEYFGEALPATVAAEPLFDPEGARLKA
jgi:heterotetrameric sarcosine oxidase gamma subunit